jgi:prepilin-type processing-associated H-X9-DG protein
MYKVIGGDEKEYGPISAEQVRQWLAQGRLNAQSRVQAEGSADWKPLAEFPELQALCSGNVSAVEPTKTCGLAIASLVFGGISLLCGVFAALPGLILGLVGLRKINRSAGALGGKGLAIAGICVSGFFMVVNIFIIVAIAIPAFVTAHDYGRAAGCFHNLKQLGAGMKLYAEDNGGKLPDAARWCDAIEKHVPERLAFRCATTSGYYLFNRNLSGIELSRVSNAERTVLLFEGKGGKNASGGGADLSATPAHRGGNNILFVDGHVERVPMARYKQLRWQADN